jgi:dienelactone hydrolase
MKKILVVTMIALISMCVSAWASSSSPTPPGRQTSGYGSTANEICSSYTSGTFGSISDGTMTYYFIPSVLKNGTKAPVVIFLHGTMMIGPEIYWNFIKHIINEGYIVIVPQYQKGFTGILSDTNQYDQISRAVVGANQALSILGAKADTSKITLWGHSTGGLISLCWEAAGGPRASMKVLANPCTDPNANAGIGQPSITALDFWSMAPSTNCPVILQAGSADTIAPVSQQCDAFRALTNSPSKVIYMLQDDTHGSPALNADHMASALDQGILPSFVMNMIGGNLEEDATDWRYYWVAMDAALAGNTRPTFDMGKWSDGRAVKIVTKVRDSAVTAVTVCQNANYAGYTAQLPVGNYTLAMLQALGVVNDDLSSVIVPAGRTVTMYKDDNFSGTSKVFTANQADFAAIGFNDVVSSIKVQ